MKYPEEEIQSKKEGNVEEQGIQLLSRGNWVLDEIEDLSKNIGRSKFYESPNNK